jgi:hypothetical protein
MSRIFFDLKPRDGIVADRVRLFAATTFGRRAVEIQATSIKRSDPLGEFVMAGGDRQVASKLTPNIAEFAVGAMFQQD